jgi:hypothetical protein
MTLVLSLLGPESVWTVADRRLTDKGEVKREDARKIMFLETTDGVAILAYAGLGATVQRTEPADWMSRVLRGRNWPLEQSLVALADALKRELPPHLADLPVKAGPSHHVLISGFVNDEPRTYSIELLLSPDTKQANFRHTRWLASTEQGPPRFCVAGSGAVILAGEKPWRRELLRLVKAYDHGRITALKVADAFAATNHRVSVKLTDGTVGPRCIVAWRNRKTGVHKGGGGHQTYTRTVRDGNILSLPTIATGIDVDALVEATTPHMLKQLASLGTGKPAALLDIAALDAALAKLPDKPDERLR